MTKKFFIPTNPRNNPSSQPMHALFILQKLNLHQSSKCMFLKLIKKIRTNRTYCLIWVDSLLTISDVVKCWLLFEKLKEAPFTWFSKLHPGTSQVLDWNSSDFLSQNRQRTKVFETIHDIINLHSNVVPKLIQMKRTFPAYSSSSHTSFNMAP